MNIGQAFETNVRVTPGKSSYVFVVWKVFLQWFCFYFFPLKDWYQKEKKLKENVEVLHFQVQQLKEENQELLAQLQCTHSKEGNITWWLN